MGGAPTRDSGSVLARELSYNQVVGLSPPLSSLEAVTGPWVREVLSLLTCVW